MNIIAAISRAACPEPHIVAGVRLLPFSIGHWLLCNAKDIAFFRDSEDFTEKDLLAAVTICSMTWGEYDQKFNRGLSVGNVKRETRLWRLSLSGGLLGYIGRVWKRCKGHTVTPDDILGFNLNDECAAFVAYLNYHGVGPNIVNDWSVPYQTTTQDGSEQTQAIKTPLAMALLDHLQSQCGMSFAEVIDMPIPFARWRWAVHQDIHSKTHLADKDERIEEKNEANEFAKKIFGKDKS